VAARAGDQGLPAIHAGLEDGDPTVVTEFKVAYDDHNFLRLRAAYDPHPDSINTLLAAATSASVVIKSKSRSIPTTIGGTGFEFAVNPAA